MIFDIGLIIVSGLRCVLHIVIGILMFFLRELGKTRIISGQTSLRKNWRLALKSSSWLQPGIETEP